MVNSAAEIEKLSISIFKKKVLGNGNQTVHVDYVKPTCNMLFLFNKRVVLE